MLLLFINSNRLSPETRVVAEKKEKRKEKGENARRNKRNVYPIGY